jgi:hypothetical protein
MRRLVLMAAFLFAVPHDTSGQAPVRVNVLFCEMVAHPENYNAKVISTEALALPGYRSLAFYDPTCQPTEQNNVTTQMVLPDSFNSTNLGKKLSKALRREHAAKVSVVGKFYGTDGPYGPDHAKFRFVVERIDSVADVSKSMR